MLILDQSGLTNYLQKRQYNSNDNSFQQTGANPGVSNKSEFMSSEPVDESGNIMNFQQNLESKGIVQSILDYRELIFSTINTFRKNPEILSGFSEMIQMTKTNNKDRNDKPKPPLKKWKSWLIWGLLTMLYYFLKILFFVISICKNYGGLLIIMLIALVMNKILVN